jgi:hypothetical protein
VRDSMASKEDHIKIVFRPTYLSVFWSVEQMNGAKLPLVELPVGVLPSPLPQYPKNTSWTDTVRSVTKRNDRF